MPTRTAGTRFYIGPVVNTDVIDAMPNDDVVWYFWSIPPEEWTEIEEVESFGDFGDVSDVVSFSSVKDGRVRKFKTTRDGGTMIVVCGRDAMDDGQAALVSAEKTDFNYAFKVAYVADEEAIDSTDFFGGTVLSAVTNLASVTDITKRTFSIGVNTKIVAVVGLPPYDIPIVLGPALREYWDATFADTYTDDGGGLISSWRGTVLGIDMVATAGARPLLTSDYLNGRAAILFDGSTDYLRAPTTTGLPTGAEGGQIWVLYESIGTPAALTYFVSYGGNFGTTVRRVGRSSSERWTVTDGTVNAVAATIAGSTEGSHMSMGRWNGTEESGRTHGMLNPTAVTIATLNTDITQITFGASNAASPASFSNVAISAVIITDDTLTLTQQQQLEAWGYREAKLLDVLPDDHPFREGPDDLVSFTTVGTSILISANPAMKPFLVDFRTSFLDQIVTRRAGNVTIYNAAGAPVQIPPDTAAWMDHDPVTNEPLGLASFGSAKIWNNDRTLATPQVFDFVVLGAPPPAQAWFDTYATLTTYALGTGQYRLQFSQPVEVLRADGTSETDWGLTPITTTDITLDCVDANADGWYNGYRCFKMSRVITTTTVTMTKVGGATILHAEACTGNAGPPTLTGILRSPPVMYSPWSATGLPKDPTSFTFCCLTKVSHVMLGAQYFTADDNDSENTVVNSATGIYGTQPVRSVSTNYLSNPRFDVPKSGFMGVTYRAANDTNLQSGIDPRDVFVEKMKWRCFFGTGDWTTGELAVSCNGGDVEREVFPLSYFVDNYRMIRWLGTTDGQQSPDGWMGGIYFEHHSYMNESDATIKAMCDPTNANGIFGIFDPD